MKKITSLILAATLLITSVGAISAPVSAASGSLRIEAEDFIGENADSLASSYTDKDASSDNSYDYVAWKQVKLADGGAEKTTYKMYVDVAEGGEGYYFLSSGLSANENVNNSTAYLSTVTFKINDTDEIFVRKYATKVKEFKKIGEQYALLYEDIFKMSEFRTYEPVYLQSGRNTIDFTVYDRNQNGTNFSSMFIAAIDYVRFDAAEYSADNEAKIEADTFVKMNTSTIGASRIEETDKASDDYYVRWTEVSTDKESTTFRMYADVTQQGYYVLHSGLSAYCNGSTAFESAVSFTINDSDTRYLRSADGKNTDMRTDDSEPYGVFYKNILQMMDYYTIEPVYLKSGRNTIDFTVYNRSLNGNFSAMLLAAIDYIQFKTVKYPVENEAKIEAEGFIGINEGTDAKKIDEIGKASSDYYIRWTEVKTDDDSTTFRMYADAAEEGEYILHAGMAAFDKRNSTAYMSPVSFTVNGTDTRYLRSADGNNIDMTTDYDADGYGSFYKNLFDMRDYYTITPVHLNKGRNTIDFTVYNRKYNPSSSSLSSIYIAGLDYISFAKAVELENPAAVLTTNTLHTGDKAQVKVMDGTKEITLSDVYQITYKSTNENVLSVDGNGTITAKLPGRAKISVEVVTMPSADPIALMTEAVNVIDDDVYVADFAADNSGNVSFKVVNRGEDDLSGIAIFAACYEDNALKDIKVRIGEDIDSGADSAFNATFSNFNEHMDVKVYVWQWSGKNTMESLLNNVFEY